MIFSEHRKYSKLVPLLQERNVNLETINRSYVKTDSVRKIQLQHQNQIITQQNYQIDNLKNKVKTSNMIAGSAIGVTIIITTLCLILK